MSDKMIRQFIKDNVKAYTAFILNDDWDKVKKFYHQYRMAFCSTEEVEKLLVVKDAIWCDSMPDDVRVKAVEKGMAMGMLSFMKDHWRSLPAPPMDP